VVQHHVNKEMCTVSVVFPLFCSTPVYIWKHYIHCTHFFINMILDHLLPSLQPQSLEWTCTNFEQSSGILYHSS
jgi:hypothetical protein